MLEFIKNLRREVPPKYYINLEELISSLLIYSRDEEDFLHCFAILNLPEKFLYERNGTSIHLEFSDFSQSVSFHEQYNYQKLSKKNQEAGNYVIRSLLFISWLGIRYVEFSKLGIKGHEPTKEKLELLAKYNIQNFSNDYLNFLQNGYEMNLYFANYIRHPFIHLTIVYS